MSPVELILSRLPHHKRNGAGWTARCPAHDDRNPFLSISEGDDGKALLFCHAGCSAKSIAAAVGLKLADLMTHNTKQKRPTVAKPKAAKESAMRVYPTAREAVAALERKFGKHSATWTYHNANGEPVGLVLRWPKADGGKLIQPVSRRDDGWCNRAMTEPRPIYRLMDLAARGDEPVYVCEGEKCADTMNGLGLLATTSAGGSGAANNSDWTPLAGRDVVLLPDNDDVGQKYAHAVAGILAKLTPPAKVRVVRLTDGWPDLPKGGDIADVVASGEDVESIKGKLGELVAAAEHEPEPVAAGPVMRCLADIEPREISWLWPGRVPMGRITLLVGKPGEGKSFLTCDMASRVTTGTPWPDGADCPQGSVILISAEDDPAETIRPRLDAHHADVRKVHLLAAVRRVDEDGKPREVMFTLADVHSLEAAIKTTPDCRLIVIDPIGSFLGGGTDAHRDNEVRSVLAPVARLAEKYGPAVLVVAHRRKGSGNHADDLALGSRAFTGIARAVWHLSRDANDKGRRLLLPGKNNLSREGDGLAFTIIGDGQQAALAWEHEPVSMSADDALAVENGFGDDHKPGPEPESRNQAAEWLRELLTPGPMAAKLVWDAVAEAGMAKKTVQRAQQALGIKPYRESFDGHWLWKLPDDAPQDGQVPKKKGNLTTLAFLGKSLGKTQEKRALEPDHLGQGSQVVLPDHLGQSGQAEPPVEPADERPEWYASEPDANKPEGKI